jgi:hypothetical protein
MVDPEPEGEVALRAEAEALRTKTREQATLIDRLQRRLGEGYVVAAPTLAPQASAEGSADSQMDRLRESISDAEQLLQQARAGASGEPARTDWDRDMRVLKAKAEDQAGEIARLKAALAAFQQPDQAGLKNSRLALKARAGSAEAQAERQAATISKLRAELAAANERLARQAAHFMEEMRRLGAGTLPPSGQVRRAGRDGRRRLAERVALVAARRPEPAAPPAPSSLAPADERPVEKPVGNGHSAQPGAPEGPQAGQEVTPAGALAAAPSGSDGSGAPAAAEMPQTPAIPVGQRKVRLLDRITGMGKS